MISAEVNSARQEQLIERYMFLPNQIWDDIINQASKNVELLKDQEATRQLANILKTNVRACRAIGHPYVSQVRSSGIPRDLSTKMKEVLAICGDSFLEKIFPLTIFKADG